VNPHVQAENVHFAFLVASTRHLSWYRSPSDDQLCQRAKVPPTPTPVPLAKAMQEVKQERNMLLVWCQDGSLALSVSRVALI